VLHPRHKLEYFKKHNWEEEWVNLPDLALALSVEHDELDCYLLAEVEDVKDGLMW